MNSKGMQPYIYMYPFSPKPPGWGFEFLLLETAFLPVDKPGQGAKLCGVYVVQADSDTPGKGAQAEGGGHPQARVLDQHSSQSQ